MGAVGKSIIYNSDSFCNPNLTEIVRCASARSMPGLRGTAFVTVKKSPYRYGTFGWVVPDPDELSWLDGRPYMTKLAVDGNSGARGQYERAETTVTFVPIEFDAEESEFTCESEGDGYSKVFKNKLTIVVPSIDHDVELAIYNMINEDLAVIFQDQNGMWRVIGSKYWRTNTSVSMTSGKGHAGKAAATLTFECVDKFPAPIFEGAIGVSNFLGQGEQNQQVSLYSGISDMNDGNDLVGNGFKEDFTIYRDIKGNKN